MNLGWTSTLLIVLGLFFIGGVISFVRQGLKTVALIFAALAALALVSGVLRL